MLDFKLVYFDHWKIPLVLHARIQKGDRGPYHPHIVFLSNTDSDPLKNHKSTKSAFNVGPSSVRQRNAILMAFRWRVHDGPLLMVFGSSHP